MSTHITATEVELVRAYQSTSEATKKASIIRRYADLLKLSLGRAEDQLDLCAYMLGRSRTVAFERTRA